MDKDISLMVLTCYTYKGLWQPFLKLKNKYINYFKTYFCVDEIKDYQINENNLEIISYGKKSNVNRHGGNFFDRLLYYLDKIPTKYIIFFLDDMPPLGIVEEEKIYKIVNIMEREKIDYVKLSELTVPYSGQIITIDNINFTVANNSDKLFNTQPCLIKREIFIDMVNYCKTNNRIYQNGGLELYGTEYFRKYNIKCLKTVEDTVKISSPAGFVASGILDQTVRIMLKEKEDIDIETFKDGLIYELTNEEYNFVGDRFIREYKRRNIGQT